MEQRLFKPLSAKPLNTVPSVSEIPSGTYKVKRFGKIVELEDGRKFLDPKGVPNRYSNCIKDTLTMSDGVASFGSSEGTIPPGVSNSGSIQIGVKLDPEFFIGKKFSKDPKTKKFSMLGSNKGVFNSGGTVLNLKSTAPTVKTDTAIMRGGDSDKKIDNSNLQTGMNFNWDDKNPFHLGIDPWITTPITSDTVDGLYTGELFGDTLTSQGKNIGLVTKLALESPINVLALIRAKKAFIFKLSQLTEIAKSKAFSAMFDVARIEVNKDRTFSVIDLVTGTAMSDKYFSKDEILAQTRQFSSNGDINSDDEFREYAHNLMKSAHKDNYSQEKTDKVVDDLLEKKEGKNYGELIGRLKSGLGNKSFSVAQGTPYTFNLTPTAPIASMEGLIGTLVMSTAVAHLFHLCTQDYPAHIALEEYYEKMPEKVDLLAENFLSSADNADFKVCVAPSCNCPIKYFEELKSYINSYKTGITPSDTESLIDDALNLISVTLYKLKRLNTKQSVFKEVSNVKTFSSISREVRLDANQVSLLKGQAVEAIHAAAKANGNKSPISDLKSTDKNQIKKYVDKKFLNGTSATDIISELFKAIQGPFNSTAKSVLKDELKKS